MNPEVLVDESVSSLIAQLIEKINDDHEEKKKAFEALETLSRELPSSSFYESLEGTFTLMSQTEKGFIASRGMDIIVWLIKKISFPNLSYSNKRYCELDFFQHQVSHPFCSKEVLSLFFEINSLVIDFDVIRKMVLMKNPEVVFVNGSHLSSKNHREGVTKIYFEMYKKGETFEAQELVDLHDDLSRSIVSFLEKPEPQFIVPSNRELLMKSFRWIIRDLDKGDLPHVYIDYNRQMGAFFQFSALICQVTHKEMPFLKKSLEHPDVHIEGICSFNEGEVKKEGAILSIDIPFHPSLSILDARKKCYLLIESLIGIFRDVNGGLLEKIEQNFGQFCKLFPSSERDLKAFFHGIYPQERQATASPFFLKILYTLIQKEQENDLELNHIVREEGHQISICIKTPHKNFEKEFRLYLLRHVSEIVFASSLLKDGIIVCCGLPVAQLETKEELKSLVHSFFTNWHQKKEVKQVLRLSCAANFTSFDPRIGTEEETSHLHKMLFEGLMRVDSKGYPEKGLAQSVEIDPSGRHYHFVLRESQWSNGRSLTAHDFLYSWMMSLNPHFFSPLSYLFFPIKNARHIKEGKIQASMLGVKVIDDLTLEVELEYPTPYFLDLCAHSSFSPICRLTDTQNPSWPKGQGEEYVCNGPFTLEKVTKTNEVHLKKNPNYWDVEKVHLKRIIILNESEERASTLFREGKIDALLYPFCKSQALNPPKMSGSQKLEGAKEIRYFYFNCSHSPFSHTKLRQAFSFALNRKILAPSFAEDAVPHYSPFSPKFTQIHTDEASEENPLLAKSLFKEALEELGISKEELMNEKIYTIPRAKGLAEMISKQLNEIFGLHLSVVVMSDLSLRFLFMKGKISLFIYAWINRINSESYFLDCFSSSQNPLNHTLWEKESITNLIKVIERTYCVKKRSKLYAKAEEILHTEKPFIPLLSTPICSLIDRRLNSLYVMDTQQFELRCSYKS